MVRRMIIGLGLMVLALGPAAAAEDVFDDDFSAARGRYERMGSGIWRIGGGQCRFAAGQDGAAVLNVEDAERVEVETTVAVEHRIGAAYATAGLTLFADSENHWRLLLVMGPDNHRYFELVERYRGTHQAQTSAQIPGTRLLTRQEGDLPQWELGHAYRLRLVLGPDAIVGEVRDPASRRFWRRTFSFGHGKAVRSGRPGLWGGGTESVFRQLAVRTERAATAAMLTVAPGPAGSVAILADESGHMAAGLERMFRGAGFGVRTIAWDELAHTRLAASGVDLLVLADARRVPCQVVRPIEAFLRARGKLVAVGAPAFGQMLLRGPQGYVDVEHYADALYAALTRRPIRLDAKAWRRSTRDAHRLAAIEPAAVGGEAGWKISLDYDGWDNFGQRIAGAFGDQQTLLCFTARGDARTPQLAIECRERDGSRWIATVALSTDARRYVLRPTDFCYWHDSKAQRGTPGDCFRPANVESIAIGLSRSHTPRSKAGTHVFWISGLSAAADPAGEEPDPRTPELQTLAPSYMLYPIDCAAEVRAAHVCLGAADMRAALAAKLLCPVGRETGLGFDRGRALRWVRLLDAYDASGRNRGAVLWLTLGQNQYPGAMWLGVGLAEPAQLLADGASSTLLRQALLNAAQAMVRGAWLLEGGTRWFSYRPGESVDVGGLVLNSARREQALAARCAAIDARGQQVFAGRVELRVPAGEQRPFAVRWNPPTTTAFPLRVTVELVGADGAPCDRVTHSVGGLPSTPPQATEFVTVDGSRFLLGGQPWTMRGMNYYANTQGGRSTTPLLERDTYDPEAVERDLAWMESLGINLLSGVRGPQPETPNAPDAFRDLHDFLDRCRRHGMKVYYFLHFANPLAGGDIERVKQHIAAAGIREHPAILAWELSWEPIYHGGPYGKKMDFLLPAWNAWIVARYGSLAEAERDWGCALDRQAGTQQAALPRHEWLVRHGPWDRISAAFRRFFDDHVGRAYGQMIRALRRYDPNHLVTFRFGACGIPDRDRFAHAHSAAVAKHVSFLCPEGYNLQTGGWATATPADDLRKGGLVTLYYRFLSREKPVVWMEFGYTVNGFHRPWHTGLERIEPAELATQRQEYENFFRMFVESGARGAAPWWLPGGFRLGEASDFGLLEPDGSERPACQVLREYLPRFAPAAEPTCVASGPVTASTADVIHLDFDAHYADAWERYAAQYLAAVKAGRMPRLGTAGSGTTSANCPLTAVGNTPCTGRNPPQYLNAAFECVELQTSPQGPWREVRSGDTVRVARGAAVRCRASVGNTGEAAWLAPRPDARPAADGTVWLRVTAGPAAASRDVSIVQNTPYLSDAKIAAFRLPATMPNGQIVTLQICTSRPTTAGKSLEIPFGERFTVTVCVAE